MVLAKKKKKKDYQGAKTISYIESDYSQHRSLIQKGRSIIAILLSVKICICVKLSIKTVSLKILLSFECLNKSLSPCSLFPPSSRKPGYSSEITTRVLLVVILNK